MVHSINGDNLAGLTSLQSLSVFVLNRVPVLGCLAVLERIYQMPDVSHSARAGQHSRYSLFDASVALAVDFPQDQLLRRLWAYHLPSAILVLLPTDLQYAISHLHARQ